MKYGIHLPAFGALGDVRLVAEWARDAERAGWDGFFLWDQITMEWDLPLIDMTVTLAAIALNTEKICFGTLVTPLARRRPVKFAREMLTLDHLSNGRVIVGVGSGISREEFEFLGEAPDVKTRAEMLDEALDLLTALWRGETVNHQGKHYTVKETKFNPTPVQQPRIPIWVAGTWDSKAPFRRAARWDGVFPLWKEQRFNSMMAPEHFKAMLAYMRPYRTTDAPLEVVHWGISRGEQAAAAVKPYAEAGVTWWLENLSCWTFGWDWNQAWSLDTMHARIMQGPPKE
jgi:alkanesulfonate monooxygenase SsuD/methylene tetrahydromethanopterin reductase-like flavin-dependent oxidoreductase (luciferase family)